MDFKHYNAFKEILRNFYYFLSLGSMEVLYFKFMKKTVDLAVIINIHFHYKYCWFCDFCCTPVETLIVCSDLGINAVQEESTEPRAVRKSLSSCDLPEEISNPTEVVSKDLLETELRSSKDLLETQVQESSREPQELGSVCNSPSLVLPGITRSLTVSYYVFN